MVPVLLLPTVVFLLFDSFASPVIAESTDVVQTTLGPVRGEILRTVSQDVPYSSFKGIRYAKPPIGYLRFRPPVPAQPWTDVVDTVADGNGCPRIDMVSKAYDGDEDCLFLNVYSPLTDLSDPPIDKKDSKAVMVWIHGGGLKTGSSNSSYYGPDFLIENDVVVVTFNYRLGALGFLALGHPNATGNAGLKDQNLVLQWVQMNIRMFGGDPDRVTIFGQSAGGYSVNYHVLSEKSAGLFSGAISMSGVALNQRAFALNSKTASAAIGVAAKLGAFVLDNVQLLETFYDASAYDLVQAIPNTHSPMGPVLENPAIVPYDEIFLSTCSFDAYQSGAFSQVPYMMGSMANETLRHIGELANIKELIAETVATYSAFPVPLPRIIEVAKNYTTSDSVYQESLDDGSSEMWIDPFIMLTTDLLYKTGVDQTQRLLNQFSSQPVYYYENSFTSDSPMHQQLSGVDKAGAAHSDDVPYLWWISDVEQPLDADDPTSIIRSRVTRMWTNFAKYGNPTPEADDLLSNVTWPVSGDSGLHLDINDELAVKPRPINDNIEMFEQLSLPLIKITNGCSQL